MTTSNFIFWFMIGLLLGWAAVSFYLRRQGVGFSLQSSGDRVFRCMGCDYVYTDDEDAERSLCPECGKMNSPVQF